MGSGGGSDVKQRAGKSWKDVYMYIVHGDEQTLELFCLFLCRVLPLAVCRRPVGLHKLWLPFGLPVKVI